MAQDTSDQNFQSEVLGNKLPVLVDFWAPWCQPCKIIGPIVDELAEEYKGKLEVRKMNVDENPEAPGSYGVMSIPTLMIFKNGEPVKTVVGAQGKEVLKQNIDEVLGASSN